MPTIILSIQIAIRSMRANKLRTGLTVLGMVIGISAVIIVFSAGEGIKSLIVSQVESFGTDVIETKIKSLLKLNVMSAINKKRDYKT